MTRISDSKIASKVYSAVDRLTGGKVKKSFLDGKIILTVENIELAERVRLVLEISNYTVEVLIFVTGNQLLYACVCPKGKGDNCPSSLGKIMQSLDVRSDWVNRIGSQTLQIIEQTIMVYKADRDRGYPVIAAKPQYTPKRLYTQNIIGTALMDAPEGIKEPRLELIERLDSAEDGAVLESGYNYFWDGYEWQFTLKAFKFEREYVFSISDKEGCHFQKDYWRLKSC